MLLFIRYRACTIFILVHFDKFISLKFHYYQCLYFYRYFDFIRKYLFQVFLLHQTEIIHVCKIKMSSCTDGFHEDFIRTTVIYSVYLLCKKK